MVGESDLAKFKEKLTKPKIFSIKKREKNYLWEDFWNLCLIQEKLPEAPSLTFFIPVETDSLVLSIPFEATSLVLLTLSPNFFEHFFVKLFPDLLPLLLLLIW